MEKIAPNLSVYQESTVVVWGTGTLGERMVCFLQQLDIAVVACCDNDPEKWGSSFYGVEVISPTALQDLQGKEDGLLVVLAMTSLWEETVIHQLEGLDICRYTTFVDGISPLFHPLEQHMVGLYPRLTQEIITSCERIQKTYVTNYKTYGLGEEKDGILLMLPRKTGDGTLEATCQKHEIPYTFGWHAPEKVQSGEERTRTVKIISALRDPIARDISDIFETISFETLFFLASSPQEEITDFLENQNIQGYFDRYVAQQYSKRGSHSTTAYGTFFDKFSRRVLDVKGSPFDVAQGYTILTGVQADLFLYQLERLDDVVAPLSQWMGVPFTALEHANIASDKWVSSYYGTAKEHLRFTQEYVDAAYEDAYVQHFYSLEQIETMKGKWLKNIK